MSSSWKDVLKQQHEDLDRLEAEDAALNGGVVNEEVEKVLRKPDSISFAASTMRKANMGRSKVKDSLDLDLHLPQPQLEADDDGSKLDTARSAGRNAGRVASTGSSSSVTDMPPGSPGSATPPAFAVDANSRYNKARVNQLQQQLDNSEQLRLKLNERVKSLEKDMKSEREEGKTLRKQIQLLESDQRRNARRSSAPGNAGADPAAMQQEVAALKKDLQTAERLVKQAEAVSKAKDTQLKRATETIARMKGQMSDLVDQGGRKVDDKGRADAAEARIKVLEKQRMDLIAAFKKQMKLIDVLKRQKMHIEAARLLSFTEEEFVKALDWNA